MSWSVKEGEARCPVPSTSVGGLFGLCALQSQVEDILHCDAIDELQKVKDDLATKFAIVTQLRDGITICCKKLTQHIQTKQKEVSRKAQKPLTAEAKNVVLQHREQGKKAAADLLEQNKNTQVPFFQIPGPGIVAVLGDLDCHEQDAFDAGNHDLHKGQLIYKLRAQKPFLNPNS